MFEFIPRRASILQEEESSTQEKTYLMSAILDEIQKWDEWKAVF